MCFHGRAIFAIGVIFGLVVSNGYTAEVTIKPDIEYQEMTGWEATSYVCEPGDPAFANYRDTLFDRLVNEVGINRLRVEIRSGVENANDNWQDYQDGVIEYQQWRALRYATVNDNADPCNIDWSGFHFSEMDYNIDHVVLPIKQRLEAGGEKLYINLNYVAFTGQIQNGSYIHDDAAEYAEFILAAWKHIDNKYGWVPDGLEIILEPANSSYWNGTTVGQAIVAAMDRLAENGYHPDIIVPSNPGINSSINYFNSLAQVPGAIDHVTEYSYHLYWDRSDDSLRTLVSQARNHGLKTGMLEWWNNGNDYHRLYKDLTVGMNSSYQQFVIRGHFDIDDSDPQNPSISVKPATKFTRQYYNYVRFGARRIGASCNDDRYDPLAWINTWGGYVAVIKADAAGTFNITGLLPGSYGINYTTGSNYNVSGPDREMACDGELVAGIPAAGVLTIYQKAFRGHPDFDCSGKVDTLDYSILADQWLGQDKSRADLTLDSTVDYNDLDVFVGSWLSSE